jgi:hypothetical protein
MRNHFGLKKQPMRNFLIELLEVRMRIKPAGPHPDRPLCRDSGASKYFWRAGNDSIEPELPT